MKRPSKPGEKVCNLRDKVIGLGERSFRKSYYPQLQDRIRELEESQAQLEDKSSALSNALNALKKSEERFRSLYENAVEGIFRTTTDGRFISASPSLASILGYASADELVSEISFVGDQLYFCPEDREKFKHTLDQEGKVSGFEVQLKRKGGELIWVSISAKVVQDRGGNGEYFQGFVVDITERKQMAEQLAQLHKMDALGTLAGGIAHDINNILGAIVGYTELAMLNISTEAKSHGYLKQALAAINRATDLVQQILTFSRKKEIEHKPIQPAIIFEDGLKMLKASLPSTIEIQQDIEVDTGMVLADATRIHQILMNLCTNAAHAMRDEGGKLHVRVGNIDFDPEEALPHPDLRSGPYVRFVIGDTGHGMDEAILLRIFDPYFTTKEPGEGTGLGLAVAGQGFYSPVHCNGFIAQAFCQVGQCLQ